MFPLLQPTMPSPHHAPCLLPLPMQTRPPLVCAHGGDSSDAPPNSADAFQAALRAGVDCVEIDVARTADNHLVRLIKTLCTSVNWCGMKSRWAWLVWALMRTEAPPDTWAWGMLFARQK